MLAAENYQLAVVIKTSVVCKTCAEFYYFLIVFNIGDNPMGYFILRICAVAGFNDAVGDTGTPRLRS